MIDILDARQEDLVIVADWLCEDDLREIALTRDITDVEALARDALASDYCKVAFDHGLPVMAFGAKRFEALGPDLAFVWAFQTDLGWRAIRAVTKHIRRTMIPTLRAVGVVKAACLVHKGNDRSCRWLAHLGFSPEATLLPGIGTPHRDLLLLFRNDDAANA
jgi:hypothetical protein